MTISTGKRLLGGTLFDAPPIKDIKAAFAAFKEVQTTQNDRRRLFYQQQLVSQPPDGKLKRGFVGHGVPKGRVEGVFVSQTDDKTTTKVHAHRVIARNPFCSPNGEERHIIILNGVSGPATFALTHALTGGVSTEFAAYREFEPRQSAEGFLQAVCKDLGLLRDRCNALQYLFEVTLGQDTPADGSRKIPEISDWRRICRWEKCENTVMQIGDRR